MARGNNMWITPIGLSGPAVHVPDEHSPLHCSDSSVEAQIQKFPAMQSCHICMIKACGGHA